ncbi:YfkD family protein [Gracilibacillus caseinilyticus]|uniref:YfkD family protein n=1 Tax=Gracilibacillus caseinilyticus TaxID=2932256 RepID=A0ABY4EWR6_9BACI|nr:YfkD family protein [Gracilibacillus caseinilyticus]UOQ48863.1 YfkD family protein [Gracilibacillus caseinilyticus]
MEKLGLSIVLCLMMLTIPIIADSEEKAPDDLTSIEKENTNQQMTEEEATIEPSGLVKELMKEANIELDNPMLIKLLNESTIDPTPFSIGYRANIYLGHWPLSYQSESSQVNWDFQTVNTNELNNAGGEKTEDVYYYQIEDKHIKGALTAKVDNAEQIKQMILHEARDQHELPLTFEAVIGKETKLSKTYQVAAGKTGVLKANIPAVKDTGHITVGEVYLELKGSKKQLVVKNVTKQEVGAYIPVANHLTFMYTTK